MPIRSQPSQPPVHVASARLPAGILGIGAATVLYCLAGTVGWLVTRTAWATNGDPILSTGLWSEPAWLAGTALFGVAVAVGARAESFGPARRWVTTALAVAVYLVPTTAAAAASQGMSDALSWAIVGAFLLYLNGWVATAVAFTTFTVGSRLMMRPSRHRDGASSPN